MFDKAFWFRVLIALVVVIGVLSILALLAPVLAGAHVLYSSTLVGVAAIVTVIVAILYVIKG